MEIPRFDETAAQTSGIHQAKDAVSMNKEAQDAKQEEMRQKLEERRRMILRTYLTNDAQERLNRIALVKPQKARSIEDLIMKNVQMRTLPEKLDDKDLVALLNQISDATGSKEVPTVRIQRRRAISESDDEF